MKSRGPGSTRRTAIDIGAIHSEVVAVGDRPTATKFGDSKAVQDLAAAVEVLCRAVAAAGLNEELKRSIEPEIQGLRRVAARKPTNRGRVEQLLRNLTKKLRGAKELLQETLALAGPVSSIAEKVGTTLAGIGWM